MNHLRVRGNLIVVTAVMTAVGCSSTIKFPQQNITQQEKLGVIAVNASDQNTADNQTTLVTLANRKDTKKIREKLKNVPTDKMVFKAFMQSFPSRTQATVTPILSNQVKKASGPDDDLDVVATGKNLNLVYVIVLKVKSNLRTTGYLYKEQWEPELELIAQMIRVRDGKLLMAETVDASDKPFDKYRVSSSVKEKLSRLYSNLAMHAVNDLSKKIGPVVRKVPANEKLLHQKIYSYSHIRTLANKNHCIIEGELRMEKTEENVLYHVPCSDITLTYACDSEKDSSRCWLQ